MDQTVQISENESIVNGMNCSCYDKPISIEVIRESMRKHFKTKPKFLYKVVEICGDYYYQQMGEEEVFEKALHELDGIIRTSDDINHYI